MIILGVDPGTTAVGCAIVQMEPGSRPELLHAGLVSIRSADTGERLCELHRAIQELIARWHPDAASVEKLFFAANAKTAMRVAEARGVILLTAGLAGVSVVEYAPREIKNILTGDGSADKIQVKKMVGITIPETAGMRYTDDVFDAIAAGLACGFMHKDIFSTISQKVERS